MALLTALNRKLTHGTVEGKDVEVPLAVEDQVPPHGVEDGPVPEDLEGDVARADILLKREAILDRGSQGIFHRGQVPHT